MKKINFAKEQYKNLMDKKPTKLMKMSNTTSIIGIICAVVQITLLVLLWTNVIHNVPWFLLWCPALVFAVVFIATVVLMMKSILKDGLMTQTRQMLNPTNTTPTKKSTGKSNYTNNSVATQTRHHTSKKMKKKNKKKR